MLFLILPVSSIFLNLFPGGGSEKAGGAAGKVVGAGGGGGGGGVGGGGQLVSPLSRFFRSLIFGFYSQVFLNR